MINPVDMLFLYKPDFKFQKAEIEKKVCLPAGEFEEFLRNPLEGLPCIEEKYRSDAGGPRRDLSLSPCDGRGEA